MRDFLINAEADEPGEDVSEFSIASVDDCPLVVFGGLFCFEEVFGRVEFRRELSVDDFCLLSSTPLSSVVLNFFFRLIFFLA